MNTQLAIEEIDAAEKVIDQTSKSMDVLVGEIARLTKETEKLRWACSYLLASLGSIEVTATALELDGVANHAHLAICRAVKMLQGVQT
jgi:hypothetical protein